MLLCCTFCTSVLLEVYYLDTTKACARSRCMIFVINCGGSGSRLWPLSTPEYPKHLLTINGGGSLLQNTYKRVKDFADEVYFITEASHAHHVKEQLADINPENIIIEPARRGTASCLLLALSVIKKKHGEDVPLAFIHADHIVHDKVSHRDVFEYAAHMAVEHQAITLVGLEPVYPSTGLGYIEKGKKLTSGDTKSLFEVVSFKEKPDRETAEEYIRTGRYLWNMGAFVADAKTFAKTMQEDAPNLFEGLKQLDEAQDISEAYLALVDDAIDYALMEKAKSLLVVPGVFDWLDVGNFQDLHKVARHDSDGNAIAGSTVATEAVSNSFIRNDSNTKLAVIGLDNVAVIVNEHGILVTNRNMAQKVGDVSKRLNKN